jgi:hypothetical protein
MLAGWALLSSWVLTVKPPSLSCTCWRGSLTPRILGRGDFEGLYRPGGWNPAVLLHAEPGVAGEGCVCNYCLLSRGGHKGHLSCIFWGEKPLSVGPAEKYYSRESD